MTVQVRRHLHGLLVTNVNIPRNLNSTEIKLLIYENVIIKNNKVVEIEIFLKNLYFFNFVILGNNILMFDFQTIVIIYLFSYKNTKNFYNIIFLDKLYH